MVTISTFVSASISKNVSLVIVYMCTKFSAFIKKCTIFLVSHYTLVEWLSANSLGIACIIIIIKYNSSVIYDNLMFNEKI